MTDRSGPFWEWVAGRAVGPPSSALLGSRCRTIDSDAGTISVEFSPHSSFLNAAATIHGGFLAAMLDEAMGGALFATLDPGHFTPTLEFKVSLIRPASLGPIIATARVVHKGASTAFLSGELSTPQGQLLATATATARIVKTGV